MVNMVWRPFCSVARGSVLGVTNNEQQLPRPAPAPAAAPAFLTPDDLAAELKLAPRTVRRLLVDGKLCAYVRAGRSMRVSREAFEEWRQMQEANVPVKTTGVLKPWRPKSKRRRSRATSSLEGTQDQTPTRSDR